MLNKAIILAALFFLGSAIVGATILNRWEIRVADRGIVWRLDRLTGHLEMCVPGQPPECRAAGIQTVLSDDEFMRAKPAE